MKQNDYEWLLRDPAYAKNLEERLEAKKKIIAELVDWIDHINLTMYDQMPHALLDPSEDIVRKYKVTKSVT